VGPLRYAVATCALWLLIAVLATDAAGGAVPWWVEYGQIINLASLPFLAATYQLPFLKSGYNYAETLSFTLYTGGHLFLWRAGLAVAGAFGAPNNLLLSIDFVLFLIYTSWALWQFHAGRVGWRPLRILVALVAAQIFGAALNLGLGMLTPEA
jgi:hypothetical protein